MANEPSRLLGLFRTAGLLVVAAGGPIAALVVHPELRANPWLAFLLVLLYELILVAIGFLSAVLRNLHDQWVNRAAEALDGWFQRRVSTFTTRYLRYIVASTRYLDVKGLSTQGEYTLEMKDVLVRLALVPTPVHKLSPHPLGRATPSSRSKEGTIWQWLRHAQKERSVLAIVGPPGSGKTTLLRHVANTLAKGGRPAWKVDAPSRIPIIINLREQRDWSSGSQPSMVDLIRRSLVHLERPEPTAWVETNLRRGHFLLMLDGLDEMPDAETRSSLVGWLEQQASGQEGNIIVVTSRPFGYRDNAVSGAAVVEVQRFNQSQIDAFVRQWYQAISVRSHGALNESSIIAAKNGADDLLSRLGGASNLSELTANPLLLTMIANVHHYRGALPGSRSELYQEICEVFLGKRHQARGVTVDLPSRQKQVVLRALAYKMMRSELSEVDSSQACAWIEGVLARVSEKLTPEMFLRGVEESAGLLIEKERGTFAFAHLTFQEFLAADYIRENGKVARLLDEIGSPWWRETILLYAAVADATPVVEACLLRSSEPPIVALAVQCVEEAREVTAKLRSLLDNVVNPADARDNRVSRQVAAQVRLSLRAARDIALKRDRFIGRSEISFLEYQYFLDSTDDSRVPDHWTSEVFPAGMDNEPVVGIRYEDAEAFCEWMKAETLQTAAIRLPRADELDLVMQREGFDPSFGRRQYWTMNSRPSIRDAGFAVLMRVQLQCGARFRTLQCQTTRPGVPYSI
ncbi:NACHT domain-containing protein [Micromonospora zamorensis]|uniref:NACHT domain-containing protein n=1 Tax=Micromonospora zamorensis TaxID=709883 RepID=UPI003CF4EF98